jgi:membrane peptidoglycan carboxypeptidase
LGWTASKTSAVGRLILMAGLGGVLAAAMVLPVVAATGILVRNTADKFTTLSLNDPAALPQRSAIFDRTGRLITYVYGVDLGPGMTYTGINRQPVSYDQISPYMTAAIVAIEDDRYWTHGAIDLKGTIRALVNNLRHQPVQGGSTIAQQFVKNVLLLAALGNSAAQKAATAESLSRKLTELRMAVEVEHQMSKQDILAGYLNDAYFGNNTYGIEAAAETYFHMTAAKLNLTQAATLAGIVENPAQYDPIDNPTRALERRNTVLARMTQTKVLTADVAAAAMKKKLGLHLGAVQSGCTAGIVGNAAFFCDYVIHTILLDKAFGANTEDRAKLLATGGLSIHTTFSPRDQAAATEAVNHVLPAHSRTYNPAHNAATEALIQPGTGKVLALAEDRPYGTGKGQTEVNFAVNGPYGGSAGVQTGSSSKLFTLITALKQGVPFGFQLTVKGQETVPGFTNCNGDPVGVDPKTGQIGVFPVVNAEGPGSNSTQTLYTGTTQSVNVFYAHLEQKVGLCNVVHTAVDMGLTRADGKSLLEPDGAYKDKKTGKIRYSQPPADDLPTFTLGAVNVSPLSMAAAYAVPAARGWYCRPIVLTKVYNAHKQSLPVPSAGCHRVISQQVADAVNYILQGVLVNGTAGGWGISGYDAAGKTGTSNVENGVGTPYAAFGGYTTALAGYVSVFNPVSPTRLTMGGYSACYQQDPSAGGGLACPPEMFGANAPVNVWHMTFDHANLSGSYAFPMPTDPVFWSQGDGTHPKQPKPRPRPGGGGGGGGGGGHGGGGGGGGGGGNVPPSPAATKKR